jgi:hypothetical protein
VRSLPWTTDREIAEFFARGSRFGPQRDPVIARAEIAKTYLFFVSVNRKEGEVILDPIRSNPSGCWFRNRPGDHFKPVRRDGSAAVILITCT